MKPAFCLGVGIALSASRSDEAENLPVCPRASIKRSDRMDRCGWKGINNPNKYRWKGMIWFCDLYVREYRSIVQPPDRIALSAGFVHQVVSLEKRVMQPEGRSYRHGCFAAENRRTAQQGRLSDSIGSVAERRFWVRDRRTNACLRS